jgi:CheY-like chemotaxis protein
MPEGGALTIETEKIEMDDEYVRTHGYGKAGAYAVISMSDSGQGMDKDTREKIFEPFYTTKEVGKGTGLGLAMVYGIIKQHNGYINVYSEPDEGTTFRIYLPLTGEEAKEAVPSVPETITKRTETVLLAEDDEDLRGVTSQILEESGYTVIEAVDGEDAVEKYKENREKIDLLILDMVMPKKSGKTVYDEIRREHPEVKALFMSGYTSDVISKKVALGEGLALISKPFRPKEFLKKIREVVSK